MEKIFPITTNKKFYSETVYKLLLKINFKLGVAYKILTDYQVWHSQSLATVIFGLDFHSTRQEIDKKLISKYGRNFKARTTGATLDGTNTKKVISELLTVNSKKKKKEKKWKKKN